eukprot:366482-Chlamydomonas_euryale.AAC.5
MPRRSRWRCPPARTHTHTTHTHTLASSGSLPGRTAGLPASSRLARVCSRVQSAAAPCRVPHLQDEEAVVVEVDALGLEALGDVLGRDAFAVEVIVGRVGARRGARDAELGTGQDIVGLAVGLRAWRPSCGTRGGGKGSGTACTATGGRTRVQAPHWARQAC